MRFGNLHDVREFSEVRVTILDRRILEIPRLLCIEQSEGRMQLDAGVGFGSRAEVYEPVWHEGPRRP